MLSFSCDINEAALSSSLPVCKHVLPHVYHEFILPEFFHVGHALLFHAALEQATSHGHQHARTVRVDGDNHFRSNPSTNVVLQILAPHDAQRLPLRVPVEAEFEVHTPEHPPLSRQSCLFLTSKIGAWFLRHHVEVDWNVGNQWFYWAELTSTSSRHVFCSVRAPVVRA